LKKLQLKTNLNNKKGTLSNAFFIVYV